MLEVKVIRPDELKKQIQTHQRTKLDFMGETLERLTNIIVNAAVPTDRLTPDGQQVFVMMTPKEVVARAEAVTLELWKVQSGRGWVVELPSLSELMADDSGKVGF